MKKSESETTITPQQLTLLKSLAKKANQEKLKVFRIRNWIAFEESFQKLVQERAVELFVAEPKDRPKVEKGLFQACAALLWIRDRMNER